MGNNTLSDGHLILPFEQCNIYKMAFEASDEAIIITTINGPEIHNQTILDVNPAFEQYTGYKQSEIVGKSPDFFICATLRDTYTAYRHRLWRHKKVTMNIGFITKTGETRYSKISSHLFRVNNQYLCITTSQNNADSRKTENFQAELLRKEHNLREKLEMVEQERCKFLRALVHELKTPLTPMIAMTEMLVYESTGISKEYAETLSKGASFLLSRINDLYDLSRSEVNMLTIKKEWVSINELVAETKSLEEDNSKLKGIQLRVHPAPTYLKCFIDRERIKQVIINLVNNAIKHNPPGCSVDIITKAAGDNLFITVKDNGVGISAEDQAKLFQPHQIKKSGGLGLGLSLSARIVELHGGSIIVRSKPNQGSKFTICLPACKTQPPFRA
ncbi:PAS domain-containing sensor histidine kinase [Dehalococcoides mccartyi]|uniref:sensor histidine kinase n=1 Tax=Dehalococcoides mccartyi TaxID=61435 RepID=UPI003D1165BE